MTGRTGSGPPGLHLVAENNRVTRLELLLDLIFVYAFLNVTSLVADDLTALGVLRGLLLLGLLWWCWNSYVWLGNIVRLDRGLMPLVAGGFITVLLVLAIVLPVAFVDLPGGLPGPLAFAVTFLLARGSVLALGTMAVWPDRRVRRWFLRSWWPLLLAAPLLLAGALWPERETRGSGQWIRLLLMLAALLAEYGGALAVGVAHWRVGSVRHWVDRHSLIILIALGETIISVGAGWVTGPAKPLTWAVIAGALFSVLVIGALWWVYFDLPRDAAEHELTRRSGAARAALARDAYTFLHLPMVAGLILLALGLRSAISALADPDPAAWSGLARLVLYGGVILYLAGLLAFEARAMGIFGRGAALGLALTVAALPLAAGAPLLAQLAILVAVAASPVLADYTVFRRRHLSLHRAAPSVAAQVEGVTPKELFFDLVFAAAFLQIITGMAGDPSWRNLLRGLAVLTLLWWAWCVFAWLASVVRTEHALARIVTILAVFVTLVVTLAVPGLFREVAGLPTLVVLVACYAALRGLHVGPYFLAARRDPTQRRELLRFAAVAGIAMVIYVGAAVFASTEHPAAIAPAVVAFWAVAFLIDLGSGVTVNAQRWWTPSAEYWADRYGLIIIVALGQLVISVGKEATARPVSGLTVMVALFGTTLVSALWWLYFGMDASAGERQLLAEHGTRQTRLAINAYVYLHLPLVAGVGLIAFGLRQKLASPPGAYSFDAPAPTLGHLSLYCGMIVFLLGDQAFWWRMRRQVRPGRAVGTVLVIVLLPVTAALPRLVALGALVTVCVGVMVVELIQYPELWRGQGDPLEPVPDSADRTTREEG